MGANCLLRLTSHHRDEQDSGKRKEGEVEYNLGQLAQMRWSRNRINYGSVNNIIYVISIGV
jgi:hypothetical protein